MKPHRRFAPHHKCLAPHQESLASQNKCFLSHHGKHLVAKPLIRIAGRPAEVRLGMWRTSASPQRAGRAGAWRLFALLVSAIFLGGLIAGCTQSQMKQAAIIMRDFSVALEKVQEAMIVAHKDGFLDDADHKRIQALIDQIALAGEEAVNTLQSANGKGAALAKLDIALMGIDHLSQEGVLHIKNPASRSTASALILSLRGIVRTAQALLQ